MHLTLEHWNDTPVFVLKTDKTLGWDRPFGAMKRADGWAYPAYYPFGLWAARDLPKVDAHVAFDRGANQRVVELEREDAEMERVVKAYDGGRFPEIPVPAGFRFHLAPFRHQAYGISRSLFRWRDFLLWEMGTGKTKVMVEQLRIRKALGKFRRALVLAPPVVLPTWERELRIHSDGELRSLLWVPSKKFSRAALFDAARYQDVIVMSYPRARIEIIERASKVWTLENLDKANANRLARSLAKYTEAELAAMREFVATDLMALDFEDIVADESHCLANWESDQTKSSLKLSTKGLRRYELTGTAGDRPDRLYSQLRFLSPSLMTLTYEQFCDKFLRYHPDRRYLVMGYKSLHALNAIIDTVSSRMKKADCLDLPPMTIQNVRVEPGPRQIARYNELVAEMRASLDVDFRYLLDPEKFRDEEAQSRAILNLPHGAARVTKLLQVASGFLLVGPDQSICDACHHQAACVRDNIKPYTRRCTVVQTAPATQVVRDFENPKLGTLAYYLEQALDEDPTNKVLIWASFLQELDDLEDLLKKLDVGYVRVDGSNTRHIKTFEERFQNDPTCRVYLGQVRSGVGITLTAANYAMYYSLPWDRIQYRQSLDRNYRPGQKRPMTVYRFMLRDTLDEFVATVLEHKDVVAYTLTEKVACAPCPHNLRCARDGVRPFRDGCMYEPNPQRPIAAVELVKERRNGSAV